jgi:membrane-associated phospholipid phosphatase
METGRSRRFGSSVAAASCLAMVVALALMVRLRWGVLQGVDTSIGTPLEAWSLDHAAVVRVLLVIELAFGTLGTITYTLGFVVVLAVNGHGRAARWTLAVMVGASATTTAMKLLLRRHRPEWHDPVHALTSFSFPSGHASGIASGMGVAVVLSQLYVERRRMRVAACAVALLLVVLVGADRVLLGVHNVSDVVAGYAVGGFWVIAMLALYPPEGRLRDRQYPQSTAYSGTLRG